MQRGSSNDQRKRFEPTRREVLAWLSAGGAALVTGCSGSEQTTEDDVNQASPRRDVPLRVGLVGTEAEAEAMRVAWSMSMEQPLDIQVLATLRDGAGDTAQIASRVAELDVAVFPQYAIGEIERSEGDVAPDFIGNYDGTINGASLTQGGEGRFGEALQFDGDDDFVTAGVVPELVTPSNLSLSIWFKRFADHAGGDADTNHAVNNVLIAHSSDANNDNFEIGTEGHGR